MAQANIPIYICVCMYIYLYVLYTYDIYAGVVYIFYILHMCTSICTRVYTYIYRERDMHKLFCYGAHVYACGRKPMYVVAVFMVGFQTVSGE